VSALPIVDGEKIVLRILRQNSMLLSLDRLDFSDINMANIKKALSSPYGIILVA
jgi:type IV pilus assembly protein PilB